MYAAGGGWRTGIGECIASTIHAKSLESEEY